jgi:hypothetical protein
MRKRNLKEEPIHYLSNLIDHFEEEKVVKAIQAKRTKEIIFEDITSILLPLAAQFV